MAERAFTDADTWQAREAAIRLFELTGWNGVAQRMERGWKPEPGTAEGNVVELIATLASEREAIGRAAGRDALERIANAPAAMDGGSIEACRRIARAALPVDGGKDGA